MKREYYKTLLEQLPIENPTEEDMARLCPHLTKEQAVNAFTNGDGYIACPPLHISNGFQILSYSNNSTPLIKWSYTGRTRASYENGKSNGDVFTDYQHIKEAIEYSKDNWEDELVLDNWKSVVQLYIQDPTDLVNDKYHTDSPSTKVVLSVALNRDFNEIMNDHSKPKSELFDDAILQMTTDDIVWHEIKGGRGGFTEFNCAHCGAGLSLSSCNGCGHTFRDDHFRCGWDTPLSKKMVEHLLKNNHTFSIDPKVAWKKECDY